MIDQRREEEERLLVVAEEREREAGGDKKQTSGTKCSPSPGRAQLGKKGRPCGSTSYTYAKILKPSPAVLYLPQASPQRAQLSVEKDPAPPSLSPAPQDPAPPCSLTREVCTHRIVSDLVSAFRCLQHRKSRVGGDVFIP